VFSDTMTLADARSTLRELVDDGHECPCCRLFAKVYSHKCDSAMARTAIVMLRHGAAANFLHVPSLPGDNHKVSQLAWWGLVIEERRVRSDGGRAGWWRLSERGVAFAERRHSIPKYARIYDARVLGFRGDLVDIEDCLGQRFSYAELIAA
jgi:hypothetical protein